MQIDVIPQVRSRSTGTAYFPMRINARHDVIWQPSTDVGEYTRAQALPGRTRAIPDPVLGCTIFRADMRKCNPGVPGQNYERCCCTKFEVLTIETWIEVI